MHAEITITLWKISKIAATKCHIIRIKCTKFDFRWGSAQTPLRSLQRSPNSLAAFNGPTFDGKGRKGGDRRGGNGREERASHTASALVLAKPIELAPVRLNKMLGRHSPHRDDCSAWSCRYEKNASVSASIYILRIRSHLKTKSTVAVDSA